MKNNNKKKRKQKEYSKLALWINEYFFKKMEREIYLPK